MKPVGFWGQLPRLLSERVLANKWTGCWHSAWSRKSLSGRPFLVLMKLRRLQLQAVGYRRDYAAVINWKWGNPQDKFIISFMSWLTGKFSRVKTAIQHFLDVKAVGVVLTPETSLFNSSKEETSSIQTSCCKMGSFELKLSNEMLKPCKAENFQPPWMWQKPCPNTLILAVHCRFCRYVHGTLHSVFIYFRFSHWDLKQITKNQNSQEG